MSSGNQEDGAEAFIRNILRETNRNQIGSIFFKLYTLCTIITLYFVYDYR